MRYLLAGIHLFTRPNQKFSTKNSYIITIIPNKDEEIMTYLSNALELLSEGDATSETIRVVLNSDMNDIVAAAEEMGEETDYVLESALEKAKELAEELRNLKELVRNRYLLLDTIPNGTAKEINVRAAEYLAQLNNGIEPISDKDLQLLSTSESWQERLEVAWTVRNRSDKVASSIKELFSNDPFEDEDGCFLIREGAGFYD